MSGFAHDIAGGNGDLIVTALQSPNFAHLLAGWQIAKNGDAEFNNLTIRGVFNGTDFQINDSGVFFYNGTPAAGNMLMSVASVSGTDEFGNTYSAGFSIYGTEGAITFEVLASIATMVMRPAGTVYATLPPQIYSNVDSAGLVTESQFLAVFSGQEGASAGNAAVQLFSASHDGSLPASIKMVITGTPIMAISSSSVQLSQSLTIEATGTPVTPTGACTLFYENGALWALGPSGQAVNIATT